MPKAEVGSTKWLGNKMKAKGLQRLRWYCQVCERQMRDANGFKQHTLSESHVRQMQVVGQNANRFINDYSDQFRKDFVTLLRTSHGEKKININHFYQEYIANKEHVHMNATKWPSLTEFAKFLGSNGICRVEEGERGLEIAWVDNSPESLRRQAAIRKKERQDKGDEEREQRLLQEQIRRAQGDAHSQVRLPTDKANGGEQHELARSSGEKVTLHLGQVQPLSKRTGILTPDTTQVVPARTDEQGSILNCANPGQTVAGSQESNGHDDKATDLKFVYASGASGKARNVFALANKRSTSNALSVAARPTPARPVSEAERIMRQELQRKRRMEVNNNSGIKSKRIRS